MRHAVAKIADAQHVPYPAETYYRIPLLNYR